MCNEVNQRAAEFRVDGYAEVLRLLFGQRFRLSHRRRVSQWAELCIGCAHKSLVVSLGFRCDSLDLTL